MPDLVPGDQISGGNPHLASKRHPHKIEKNPNGTCVYEAFLRLDVKKNIIPLGIKSLEPHEFHLWLVELDDVGGDLNDVYLSLLNSEERDSMSHFHFARDSRRYLVTRALLRTVLSRYACVAPRDWCFSKNSYGCPSVADTISSAAHLHFNLSHTRDLIVLAVGGSGPVGVDVESILLVNASAEIAYRFFAPDEVGALGQLPADEQRERFFDIWTLKESYIKARGMGLSIPLDKFSFDLSRIGAINLRIDPELDDLALYWQFWQFRYRSEYTIALCAAQSVDNDIAMEMIKTVPMVWEDTLELPLLRTSLFLPD